MAERVCAGHSLSGNVVSRSMRRRCTYDGQPCGVVHPLVHGECLEGCQSLIVIHSQYTVEVHIVARAHESVGRIGSETQYSLGLHFLHGRYDYACFLSANQAVVSRVGIEREDGYARRVDAEILLQRAVENLELFHDAVLGHPFHDVSYGHMTGDECHAEIAFQQNHECLASIAHAFFNVFGMSGEVECFRLDGILVDRGCNEHINFSILIVGQCSFQCIECRLSCFGRRLSQFHLQFVFGACQYV